MEYAEEWRPIDGYEGVYEVSNLGRVRSLKFGKVRMRAFIDNLCGYFKVCLCRDGKKQLPYVHRLVALAFLPNPSRDRVQVNHINSDSKDNRAENLEWVTQSENERHASKSVKRKRLEQSVILQIAKDVFVCGLGTHETSVRNCVSTRVVRSIKSGETHAKLTAHLRT